MNSKPALKTSTAKCDAAMKVVAELFAALKRAGEDGLAKDAEQVLDQLADIGFEIEMTLECDAPAPASMLCSVCHTMAPCSRHGMEVK